MGSGAFLILYFSAGIFGNVLGGNFALVGVPSVGASGAIFGTVAVMWVDLLAHWKLEYKPWRKVRSYFPTPHHILMISLVGAADHRLDHWSGTRIRPWLVASCLSLVFWFRPVIAGVDNFAHLGGFLMGLLTAIVLYPVISTTNRHKAIMWFCRLAMIPIAVVLFVVLIRNFYKGDPYAGMFTFR